MKMRQVNIGEAIRQKVEEAGMTKSQFAAALHIARQNVEKTIFLKHGLDTDLLCRVCEVLDYNFFNYFQDDSNTKDYEQRVVKATLSIEMGANKQDKQFKFVFGDNKIEIK